MKGFTSDENVWLVADTLTMKPHRQRNKKLRIWDLLLKNARRIVKDARTLGRIARQAQL
jgi:hypothetical protein